MITIRHVGSGRRRRPVFTSMRGLGNLPQVTMPSLAPRAAALQPSLIATPQLVATEQSMNIPRIPQPSVVPQVMHAATEQSYATPLNTSPGPGDEETYNITREILVYEEDPTGGVPEARHTFAQDEQGRYLDSEGRPIGVSPTVAPQGDFIKTWGPPLLAVAGIGLAVWILRR